MDSLRGRGWPSDEAGMTWRTLWLRWRAVIWPRRTESELAEELAFHLEMQTRKHRAAGVDAAEAVRRAQLEFGNATLVKDDARDVRTLPLVDETLRNVRYVVRSLRRAPAFTLAVVVTIGLGVGLNATVFTVFDAYVLRPFNVRDPYALYSVSWMDRTGRFHDFSQPGFDAMRRPNAIFSDLVAFHPVTARLNAIVATGDAVTEDYFSALGLHPALGRLLLPDDRGVAVVVLGHSAWQRRFGGDSSIIGRRVPLRGRTFQIVGVAQAGFEGLFKKPRDFWVPLGTLSAFDSMPMGGESLSLIARLRHGVSAQQGEAFVTSSLAGVTAALPDSARVARASLTSRASALPKTLTSYAMFAPLALAFGLVLMLACANVANMLLARGVARQREPRHPTRVGRCTRATHSAARHGMRRARASRGCVRLCRRVDGNRGRPAHVVRDPASRSRRVRPPRADPSGSARRCFRYCHRPCEHAVVRPRAGAAIDSFRSRASNTR